MKGALRMRAGAPAILLVLGVGMAGIAAPYARAQGAPVAPEAPVAKEKNPPGDIPDDQVFITYKSPLGFSMKVPEGWARTNATDSVAFADKYGQITVDVKPATRPLTVLNARANEAPELEKTGHAVKISTITEVKLPGGPAVRIVYSANSDPNPVTSKQIRLECERFLVSHGDKLAILTFSSPAGADNADQWTLMSQSFRWQ